MRYEIQNVKSRAVAWILVLAVCSGDLLPAQEADDSPKKPTGQFLSRVFEDAEGAHRYQVFLPAGYDKRKRYPTILYLHGAEECGRDGLKPVQVGLGPFVRARATEFPCIVVFPQCETTSGVRFLQRWQAGSPDAKRALAILDEVERDFSVDRSREILTGWSMGGYGSWSLGAAIPARWAAVVPVAGGGDPVGVRALRQTPVWAVHGPEDKTIYPERSREMVKALRAAGGRVRYDEPPAEAHDVWKRIYDSAAFETWVVNPRKPLPAPRLKLVARGTKMPQELAPFVPVAHIGGAAYLRVGDGVLQAFAAAIPQVVPEDILSGSLEPLSFPDEDGQRGKDKFYEATLDGITYRGEIHAAAIKTRANGTVMVRMALKNIVVTIAQTLIDKVEMDDRKVDGEKVRFEKKREQKFSTSATQILIAHRQPVVLEFEVKPQVKERHLKLTHLATRFRIAPDQYVVRGPAAVEAGGAFPGIKRQRVFDEVVNGLAGQRMLVEQKIKDVVPLLIQEMERELAFSESSDLFRSLWPLPVYQPRVRLWPEALVVDETGLSMSIGMSVAAPDPATAPEAPRELTMVRGLINHVPKTQTLRIGFAPGLLEPLTQLLIDGGVARIDVRDAPEKLVQQLGDRRVLAEVIPLVGTLPATTAVRSELVLTQPISIRPTKGAHSAAVSPMGFQFRIPGAQLQVSTRPAGKDSRWSPLAIFDITLSHNATLQLMERQASGEQPLEIKFPSPPSITMTGRFAKGVDPVGKTLDTRRYQRQFDAAWRAFADKALQSNLSVSDFAFGDVTIPLRDIAWSEPLMSIEFSLEAKRRAALRKIQQARFEKPIIKPAGGDAPRTITPDKRRLRPIKKAEPRRRKSSKR